MSGSTQRSEAKGNANITELPREMSANVSNKASSHLKDDVEKTVEDHSQTSKTPPVNRMHFILGTLDKKGNELNRCATISIESKYYEFQPGSQCSPIARMKQASQVQNPPRAYLTPAKEGDLTYGARALVDTLTRTLLYMTDKYGGHVGVLDAGPIQKRFLEWVQDRAELTPYKEIWKFRLQPPHDKMMAHFCLGIAHYLEFVKSQDRANIERTFILVKICTTSYSSAKTFLEQSAQFQNLWDKIFDNISAIMDINRDSRVMVYVRGCDQKPQNDTEKAALDYLESEKRNPRKISVYPDVQGDVLYGGLLDQEEWTQEWESVESFSV
ncbi:unnamed protein product [Periconia digitata]|uniref:Uncharacterized protein n=1 Tax=Periconia digitata TaxID=1303443 RepID=A0A9W4UCP7_9PLEO|nr:unnamed protein product [Periconia digitata]